MKKLAFLFVAVSAISFASCGNGTKATETANDSICNDTVEVCCAGDSVQCDSVCGDTAAVVAE